ncbi:16S ribosomal RNA methyltransferase KsgA/Dim1 family protein [Aquisphaera giovannonii]|uniref:16S ribosomal RNA methyltransferase KsgA/Dim1 family protein n=1 Tax=Aquisphaera giovannonii TaxID=406548 RepID=A0A5B9VZ91_9BACT|nr:ornithine lipid N-methyltransferase [Aquisphaera giovannonii]QEH32990.1 16S ribosomal RNA methyltransferase KsgA/Dim1 family protein [Aquisphaera giovannonii]
MSDFGLFFGKFLRQGTAIASLAPSSPWLSRATVREVDWATARVVVELGAGTGPITRVLAERAPDACRVVVLERDPDFARLLRERFSGRPNLDVVEGDVRDLAAILADRGVTRADAIVSGLPVPSFPADLTRSLFRDVGRLLPDGGLYSQITELPWVYWRFYRRFFEDVRFAFEPRNLPPAGAYFCRGVKPLD